MTTITNPQFGAQPQFGLPQAPEIRPARMLPPVQLAPRVSLGRLIQVELRKLTDTRASRWLLALVAAGAILAAVVCTLWLPELNGLMEDNRWTNPMNFIALPFLLVPVVAILVFTQEWSQRTSLTTFTLEPRRGLVLAAKAAVVVLLGVAAWLVMLGLTAVASGVGGAMDSLTIDWSLHLAPILSPLVQQLLVLAVASGLALLLMNSPAAIALLFVLPNLLAPLSMIPGGVGKAISWIDYDSAWGKLFGTMTGTDWAKAAVCAVIWLVIPIGLGVLRNLRAEAK